ncbi:hypothetical protein PRK78_002304 [Emydomyces testavorans]|uniref:Uncharacterized protein n=1 Tax=Emydomyces testavorans TaxID=2070801 RepID=A0AAF0IJI9_9EURO|nr:hypothetical protein PRK78_002304 [Emydomyces testavorans]
MASSFEPSMLEYARFHGIAYDHLAIDPVSSVPPYASIRPEKPFQESKECFPLDLDGLRELIHKKHKEKLSISKAGAAFLTSVIRPHSSHVEWGSKLDEMISNYRRIMDIRQELPILRTDHEHDMHVFRGMLSLDKMEVDLPLEQINDENDEGFVFPSYVRDLPIQIHDQISKEKLDCTREVLLFMHEARTAGTLPPGYGDGEKQPKYTRRSDLGSITPPLLPGVSMAVPFIPSSPNMEMELLSEPVTPAIPEHKQIERALIADANVFSEKTSDSGEDGKPSQSTLERCGGFEMGDSSMSIAFSSPKKRTLSQSTKVDGPLTPPISVKKRREGEGGNLIAEILKDIPMSRVPLDEDQFLSLSDMLQTSAVAKQQIESKMVSERIRGIKADVRIKIPKLTILSPKPPWLLAEDSGKPSHQLEPIQYLRELITTTSEDHDLTSQSCMSKSDEWNLHWDPFPAGISRMHVRESIEDDVVLSDLLMEAGYGNHGDWPKRPYFKDMELEGGSDEDVLDPKYFEEMKLSADLAGDAPANESKVERTGEEDHKFTHLLPQNLRVSKDGSPFSSLRSGFSLLSAQFSTATHLSNFMSIRGNTTQTREVSSPYFARKTPDPTKAQDSNESQSHCIQVENDKSIPRVSTAVFDLPALEVSAPPFLTLFISNSLLRTTYCSVIKILESLSMPKTLIFRDYSAMALQPKEGSRQTPRNAPPARSGTVFQTACEEGDADIIVSPNTGILFATSQETTQLYLPGHSPIRPELGNQFNSPVRGRIFRACLRSSQASMSKKTLEAVRGLMSFCSSLAQSCDVIPLVVPAAAEQLAKWVINLANKHAMITPWSRELPSPKESANASCVTVPSEDPTVWENFLYHLGLNCFAAQIVLCSPISSTSSSFQRCSSPPGFVLSPHDAMSTFVSLHPNNRRRIYGPLIGEKLVAKVSAQLDFEW